MCWNDDFLVGWIKWSRNHPQLLKPIGFTCKNVARLRNRYKSSSTIVKIRWFYVKKQQTEWAYRYKTSSIIQTLRAPADPLELCFAEGGWCVNQWVSEWESERASVATYQVIRIMLCSVCVVVVRDCISVCLQFLWCGIRWSHIRKLLFKWVLNPRYSIESLSSIASKGRQNHATSIPSWSKIVRKYIKLYPWVVLDSFRHHFAPRSAAGWTAPIKLLLPSCLFARKWRSKDPFRDPPWLQNSAKINFRA